MIYSMTAYARHEMKNEEVAIYWDLRSVNHKYLELSLKVPEELRELEHVFRDIIKKNINRGKVDCCLKLDLVNHATRELVINETVANQVITACQKLGNNMQNSALISPLDVLKWPLVIRSDTVNLIRLQELLKNSLIETLKILNNNKKQEGLALLNIIRKRLEDMENQIKIINQILPQVMLANRVKLIRRLQELEVTYDAGRLEQEMLYLVQKSDIAEEMDRLSIHINETKRILNQGGMIGRRLDFMMQEINRETNTMSAKSTDPQIALAAVELKVLIEQIREQSQNLE